MKKSFKFIQKNLVTLINASNYGILAKEVNEAVNATFGCDLKPRCYPQLVDLCDKLGEAATHEDTILLLSQIQSKIKEARI